MKRPHGSFLLGSICVLRCSVRRSIGRAHRDESGSISLASVFGLLLLTFLLGMLMNSTRQAYQKVRMQNAADAATYAGGVVVSRNMNTLAFTNHLLCDVFALTAYMREGRDRKAESLTPEILANWARVAPAFQGSEFPRFDQLGFAIEEKVPLETDMIQTYSDWAAAASELMLPVLEPILAEQMIPEFQRSIVETTPQLAQHATDEVARRHGASWPRPEELRGVLWRTNGDAVGGVSEGMRRTLPVVDPVMEFGPGQDEFVRRARKQREHHANVYLTAWNDESLEVLDRHAKMSRFSNLWRIFTKGNLEQLLKEEYPFSNLPFQLRTPVDQIDETNAHLEQDFMFVGVVYRPKSRDWIPGIFRNPSAADAQAYAQMMVFVPKRRLVKDWVYPGRPRGDSPVRVGVPGDNRDIVPPPDPAPPADDDGSYPIIHREWHARHQDIDRAIRRPGQWGLHRYRWDLMNQNWAMQLVPATAPAIPQILSTPPVVNGISGVQTPDLRNLDENDLRWLSHH